MSKLRQLIDHSELFVNSASIAVKLQTYGNSCVSRTLFPCNALLDVSISPHDPLHMQSPMPHALTDSLFELLRLDHNIKDFLCTDDKLFNDAHKGNRGRLPPSRQVWIEWTVQWHVSHPCSGSLDRAKSSQKTKDTRMSFDSCRCINRCGMLQKDLFVSNN